MSANSTMLSNNIFIGRWLRSNQIPQGNHPKPKSAIPVHCSGVCVCVQRVKRYSCNLVISRRHLTLTSAILQWQARASKKGAIGHKADSDIPIKSVNSSKQVDYLAVTETMVTLLKLHLKSNKNVIGGSTFSLECSTQSRCWYCHHCDQPVIDIVSNNDLHPIAASCPAGKYNPAKLPICHPAVSGVSACKSN